jgi:nitronate monooxygenase
MSKFQIIQGGMGVGVSNWRLARAVSMQGQLGVVSGTGVAVLLARRLQTGDADGAMRRGLAAFPLRRIAQSILKLHFVEGGADQYRLTPMPQIHNSRILDELTVAAGFVEVYLAKEEHEGLVGLNLLEKIQTPTLATLYGAMLAGVDYVLMGAGIPRFIPGALDAFAVGMPAEMRIDVANAASNETFASRFDPAEFLDGISLRLSRPKFLPIVASATLAMTLERKSNGKVDGFVVELPTAGGHNAPPRGPLTLNAIGEPIYGERDNPDLEKIRDLGLPFYMAGGYASPAGLSKALASGAQGIQVGTLFAFCEESGIDRDLKARTREMAISGIAGVYTDPRASPTGFPFKVLQMPGTLSESGVYEERRRVCDLGYLRHAYKKEDGSVGYRCPSEPIADYVKKGGDVADTVGRKCLCNGLFGTLGVGHIGSKGVIEPAIMTSGDDVVNLVDVIRWAADHGAGYSNAYTAHDVLGYLLSETPSLEHATSETAGSKINNPTDSYG